MVEKTLNKKLKICMITSEAVPFAKSGGLGDMVSALALALHNDGYDVRIIMPRYYSIDRSGLEALHGPMGVPVGLGEEWCQVYRGTLPHSSLHVYFIDHERLFGRAGIYGASPASSFDDNLERFTLLSRGAFQLCKKIDWIPNIMHAHDWPTALVSVYLQTWERYSQFIHTASVFTVHNLGYQGWFSRDQLMLTQIGPHDYLHYGLESMNTINLMKAGLTASHFLTTVSPTYAQEVCTQAYGEGLDGLFRYRKADLMGILNGVDYDEWNPKTDHFIVPHNYDEVTVTAQKKQNKLFLQREFGLPEDEKIAVFGMISRLTEQKGLDLLFGAWGAFERICQQLHAQVVVIGTGEDWAEEALRHLSYKYPQFKAKIVFDNRLSHLVEAGSDFFLMPSRYEPCGLNQLYSLKYGTLPIVRRTGGLADTVIDHTSEEGTGFLFNHYNQEALFWAVDEAIKIYYNQPKKFTKMRLNAMQQDFSWQNSVKIYEEAYERAIVRRQLW
jgi:starch synthase